MSCAPSTRSWKTYRSWPQAKRFPLKPRWAGSRGSDDCYQASRARFCWGDRDRFDSAGASLSFRAVLPAPGTGRRTVSPDSNSPQVGQARAPAARSAAALCLLEVRLGGDVSFLQTRCTHHRLRLPQPSIQLIRLEGAVADVEGRDEGHLLCSVL